MVKISQYEQSALADPAVGTPGVDNSGGEMLNKLSSGFETLGTSVTGLQEKQNVQAQADLEEKQKNMARIIDAQVKMAQDVSASNKSVQLQSGLDNLKAGIQSNYQDIPDQAPGEMMRQGQRYIQNFIKGSADFVAGPPQHLVGGPTPEAYSAAAGPAPQFTGISDPVVAAKVQEEANTYLKTSLGEVTNHWVTEQKTKNAFNDASTGIESLIQQAQNPNVTKTAADVGALQAKAQALLVPNLAAFGHEAPTVIAQTKDKIAMAYFDQLLASGNVNQAQAELKSGAFTQTLSATHQEAVAKELNVRTHAAIMEGKQTSTTQGNTDLVDIKSKIFNIISDPTTTNTQKSVLLRQLAPTLQPLAQQYTQGTQKLPPNPQMGKEVMTQAEEAINAAKAYEAQNKTETKEAQTEANKTSTKMRENDIVQAKASFNSPESNKKQVDFTNKLGTVLTNTQGVTKDQYIKNLTNLHTQLMQMRPPIKQYPDGRVWRDTNWDTFIKNRDTQINGAIQNAAKADTIDKHPFVQMGQQMLKSVQFWNNSGAPKPVQHKAINVQDTYYNGLRNNFIQKMGRQPTPTENERMFQHAKTYAINKALPQ